MFVYIYIYYIFVYIYIVYIYHVYYISVYDVSYVYYIYISSMSLENDVARPPGASATAQCMLQALLVRLERRKCQVFRESDFFPWKFMEIYGHLQVLREQHISSTGSKSVRNMSLDTDLLWFTALKTMKWNPK